MRELCRSMESKESKSFEAEQKLKNAENELASVNELLKIAARENEELLGRIAKITSENADLKALLDDKNCEIESMKKMEDEVEKVKILELEVQRLRLCEVEASKLRKVETDLDKKIKDLESEV